MPDSVRRETMSRNTDGGKRRESKEERPPEEGEPRAGPGTWLMSTAMQTLIAVVGLVVVLFALGRAFGIDLLGMVGDALATQTGQWIAIAVLALILMGAAMRAITYTRARR